MRCSQCGALFDAEDIALVLLEKQSQLERFGLLTPSTGGSESPMPPAMHGTLRLKKD